MHSRWAMDALELQARTQKFALDVDKLCGTLPTDRRTQEIADQLHAAAHSTAMNYRAVCRARSDGEFFAKLCITLEEADEAEGWIDTLIKSGRAGGSEPARLLDEASQLVKIFAASKRTVRVNAARRKADAQSRDREKRR